MDRHVGSTVQATDFALNTTGHHCVDGSGPKILVTALSGVVLVRMTGLGKRRPSLYTANESGCGFRHGCHFV